MDWERCCGCRQCQEKCYFDAIRYDRRQHKCQVDIRNCYGCGTCRVTCQEDAISLLDRGSIPLIADSWQKGWAPFQWLAA